MPNRIIKESICTSKSINQLTAEEECFFYRLIVNCDDYGCFFGEPDVLAGKLYPRRRMEEDEVLRIRDRLEEVGLIIVYESGGEDYIWLPTWEKHQRIRSAKHHFPMPPEESLCKNSPQLAANCGELPQTAADCSKMQPTRARARNPIQSNPNPIQSESNPNTNPNAAGADVCAAAAAEPKTQFAEFVSLTNAEYEALVAKLGEQGAGRCIELLDNYKGQSGKKYQSDYRAILNWVVGRYEEEQKKAHRDEPRRSYDPEDFDRIGFELPEMEGL